MYIMATKLNNTEYSYVRGFNYQPNYASSGLEIWGKAFDLAVFREGIGLGKKYFPGINTIRLWLSLDAFIKDLQAMADRFHSVVDLADEFGARFIPTLFNGWYSLPNFGGISAATLSFWGREEGFRDGFRPYIESIMKPHADDERILFWDLCNEPFCSAFCDESKRIIMDWLTKCYQTCKDIGVSAPLTVGASSFASMKMLAPISDVLTFHPYYAWNAWIKSKAEFVQRLDETVAFANSENKPLIATETAWGSLDDKQRAETLTFELDSLVKRDIGFTAHLLCHTPVADGHRPEHGLVIIGNYMAFVENDGSLRPYHEIFNEF